MRPNILILVFCFILSSCKDSTTNQQLNIGIQPSKTDTTYFLTFRLLISKDTVIDAILIRTYQTNSIVWKDSVWFKKDYLDTLTFIPGNKVYKGVVPKYRIGTDIYYPMPEMYFFHWFYEYTGDTIKLPGDSVIYIHWPSDTIKAKSKFIFFGG